MISIPIALLVGGVAGILLLAVVVFVLTRRRGDPPSQQMSAEDRSNLLHNGLRAQATITSVNVTGGGRFYVTAASAIDPVSGRLKTYTQRGARSVGRRGEPVTVLVDAARPNLYLIVTS